MADELTFHLPSNYNLVGGLSREKSEHGGVAIYFKKGLEIDHKIINLKKYSIIKELELYGYLLPKPKIILISIYRIPNISVNKSLIQLEDLFSYLHTFKSYECIVVGDLNLDVLKSNNDINKI